MSVFGGGGWWCVGGGAEGLVIFWSQKCSSQREK